MTIAIVLIFISFISGIGITTIGPGGIFLTIALYSLTAISSGMIAGTVQVAFIFTGIFGSLAYIRSGEISRDNLMTISILCIGSVAGALSGSWLNQFVSRNLFGVLLGSLAGIVGVIILYREARSLQPILNMDAETRFTKAIYLLLGIILGIFSGLLGIGGPVIAVPALVIIGIPVLYAVAAAQVQSIFIAFFSATGYFLQGQISMLLAILIGLPLTVGVILGWKIAHYINPNKLKATLGIVLLLIAPYLAL